MDTYTELPMDMTELPDMQSEMDMAMEAFMGTRLPSEFGPTPGAAGDIWYESVPLEQTPSNLSISSAGSFQSPVTEPMYQWRMAKSPVPALSQMSSYESLTSIDTMTSIDPAMGYGDVADPAVLFGAPLEFSNPVVPSPPSSDSIDIRGYFDTTYYESPSYATTPMITPVSAHAPKQPPLPPPQQQHHHQQLHRQQPLQQHQALAMAGVVPVRAPPSPTLSPSPNSPAASSGSVSMSPMSATESSSPVSATAHTNNPVTIPTGPCTKWVKLSRMTAERIERIKDLAAAKGIDAETVESVLALYSDTYKRVDNDVNRYDGDDVFIKITMGASASTSNVSGEDFGRRGDDRKKKHRKSRPNYVKRPLNSFMLYRKSQTQSAMAYSIATKLKLNHQNISQIIGLMWQTESKELKDEFAKFAGQEKEIHKALHPDYKFCPQKKKRV